MIETKFSGLQSQLKSNLINSTNDIFQIQEFNATLDAHGKYETMRFVLRLSPKNHALLKNIENGRYPLNDIPPDAIQAYSTYLHETIHWWQHIGSTSGLMLSLSYLGQSHSSLAYLRDHLEKFGPIKSLKRWADNKLINEGYSAQSKIASANIAVNNFLDIEYYKIFAMSPKYNAENLFNSKHFECIGHSYNMAYGQFLGMISSTIDPDFSFLPKGEKWDEEFMRIRASKHEGFYHGSPMRVAPIGLHAIYEGQARFIQLQFLNGTQFEPMTTVGLREQGYLSGIYVEAFEVFLKLSNSKWPANFSDSLISIFLLVCDIAINPTRGIPLDIESYEDFIRDVDVGVRFSLLCQALAELPHLKSSIEHHSKKEYIDASEELTAYVGYDHPFEAITAIVNWRSQQPTVQMLMEEHRTFKFEKNNLPVRVLFSHFVDFYIDRFERPEFFCWPGIWKTSASAKADINNLWLKHLSLFSDDEDKPGVYPRKWPNREDSDIKDMFKSFYGSMALYDLTRQWVLYDGPFIRDYRWLFEKYSQKVADDWANDTFKKVYGVELSSFQILSS